MSLIVHDYSLVGDSGTSLSQSPLRTIITMTAMIAMITIEKIE